MQKAAKIMVKKFMLAGIRFYRKYLSPLKTTRCPYIPTCSEYGLEAIEKYGALKGGLMALWRILRCNPFLMADMIPFRKQSVSVSTIKGGFDILCC